MFNLNLNKRAERLQKKTQNWQIEKPILIAEQDLQEDIKDTKNRKKPPKEQKKALTTTKFLMLFLFISCSIIQLFTMYAVIKGMNMGYGIDFTPLTMLISAVVAQTIGFSVYSLKSVKENTKGGIIFETAMINSLKQDEEKNKENEENEEEIAEG